MSDTQQPKTGAEAIEQRDTGYGGFANVAHTKRSILNTLEQGGSFDSLDAVERTALEEIAGKLARIVNGSTKADNWIDISGYAELVLVHSQPNALQLNPKTKGKR